ncbi:MAG: glutamate ligase domain-containing protein, partial [Clostridia bacterium]
KNPARLEMLAENLIFDGAHNPNGVGSLINALDRYFPNQKQTVIFACMKDKEIIPSLKMLAASDREFIFTQVEGNLRSMSADDLQSLAASVGIEGESRPNLTAAVKLAKEKGRLTVICGSLYLYETVPAAVIEWKTGC